MAEVKNRDLNLDALRGFAILGVLGLHSLNNSARHYTTPQTNAWWAVMLTNRTLNYVVPLFLALSALLYARASVSGKPLNWPSFQARRLPGILYPYILWSFVAIAFRIVLDGGKTDLLNPGTLIPMLMWGKAMFHLYFMVILVQLVLVFPVLNAAVKRYSGSFGVLVGLALALQILAFFVQSKIKFSYPATTIFWYITPVVPAIWIGQHYNEWVEHRCRIWSTVRVASAFAAWICFMGVSYVELLNENVNGFASNFSLQVYGLFATILFIGVAAQLTGEPTSLRRGLAWVGVRSLPMYLIHPFLMRFLGGPSLTQKLAATHVGSLLAYGLLVLCTILAVVTLQITRLDWILMGPSVWPKKAIPKPT